MTELTTLLGQAVGQAQFADTRLGTLSPSALQDLYRRQPMWLMMVDTEFPQTTLESVVASLKLLLPKHIKGDHVGDGLAFFLRGSAPWSVAAFARDMVRTAAILGAVPTVNLLTQWESGEPIPFESHIVLEGISVEQPIETPDGIRVVPMPTSSNELSAELPGFLQQDIGIMELAGAAKLLVTNTIRSAVFREHDPTMENYEVGVVSGPQIYSNHSLDLLCQSLALATNSSAWWRAAWSECAAWRAFGHTGTHMSYHSAARSRSKTPIDQETLLYALTLFGRLSDGEGIPPRLSLAIDRWVMSKGGRSLDDQFIDLRIVLEALYLSDDDRGEFTFRVALYGAWHLGTDPQDREQISKCLRDLYGRASRAIHGNTKDYTDKDRELLSNAQDLCRKSILKMLDHGRPDFRSLSLGE